jgi:hypothetical protein
VKIVKIVKPNPETVTLPELLKLCDRAVSTALDLEHELEELEADFNQRLADSEAAYHSAMVENLRLKQLLVPFLQDEIDDFPELLGVKQ